MNERRCRYLERNLSPCTDRAEDRLGKLPGWGQAWGPGRGTRNSEETPRESSELLGPSPHYHAPRLPSHYMVVPIKFHHGFQNGHSTAIIGLPYDHPSARTAVRSFFRTFFHFLRFSRRINLFGKRFADSIGNRHDSSRCKVVITTISKGVRKRQDPRTDLVDVRQG